jgi:hypothetical protein
MQMIELVCEACGRKFQRYLKEYQRCKKRGFHVSCGRTCGAVLRNRKCSKGNLGNLNAGNRQDEYSPFRYYVSKAFSRQRKNAYGVSDITVKYLKDLWEQQKGICPYTHHLMDLPVNTQDHNIKGTPTRASLDRIDSSKGYVKGNVEFVCLAVNLAKCSFTKEQMIEFFRPASV